MKGLQGISRRAVAPSTRAAPSRHRPFSSHSLLASSSSSSSSTSLKRPGRPALICPTCHHQLPRRSFHVASLANAAVDITEATISQLHHVTLTPWYITIPLVALSVNLVFRLPLSAHARNLTLKRARLNPLLRSWTTVHTEQVLKERQRLAATATDHAPVDMSVASVQAEVMKRHTKTSARIYSAFGVQQWKLYANILALPPWLVVIEAIRRMCGAPVGLLGMVFRKSAEDATPAAADVVSTLSPLSDPSFATGGCLWFPDLTAADPYHVLPFALSAVLVVNLLPSTDAGRRMLFGLPAAEGAAAVVVQSPVARGIHRSLLIMSCSVGFVTLNFPAAIHLYWLSSAGTTYGISKALLYLKPVVNADPPLRQHREGPWIVPRQRITEGE